YLYIVYPQDVVAILRLAYRLKITYYDASYVIASSELNVPLITDDTTLRNRIKSHRNVVKQILGKEVNVLSSDEYITYEST
ncbi:MAG: hypothetical protein DRO18_00745, partial [Thermoprotei archaeon]